jgi:phage repressor protein C with HTH and peptisase S24 domain
MKVAQFSAKIGVPRTTLIGWENGKSVPIETAEKLHLAIPDLNITWLLTGEGSMFIQPPEPAPDGKSDTVANLDGAGKNDTVSHLEPEGKYDTVSHLEPDGKTDTVSPLPGQEDQAVQSYDSGLLIRNGHKVKGRRAVELAVERADPEICFVNFYSAQSAGAGPGRDIEAYLEATRMPVMRDFLSPWRPEQIQALEVRGDSMTKVGLFDRDIVLYVPKAKEGDGIYVISIDSKMQVKRIEFDILGETLKVISENDRYAPRVLNTKELIEKVVIEGKVIGWLHRHPY